MFCFSHHPDSDSCFFFLLTTNFSPITHTSGPNSRSDGVLPQIWNWRHKHHLGLLTHPICVHKSPFYFRLIASVCQIHFNMGFEEILLSEMSWQIWQIEGILVFLEGKDSEKFSGDREQIRRAFHEFASTLIWMHSLAFINSFNAFFFWFVISELPYTTCLIIIFVWWFSNLRSFPYSLRLQETGIVCFWF